MYAHVYDCTLPIFLLSLGESISTGKETGHSEIPIFLKPCIHSQSIYRHTLRQYQPGGALGLASFLHPVLGLGLNSSLAPLPDMGWALVEAGTEPGVRGLGMLSRNRQDWCWP